MKKEFQLGCLLVLALSAFPLPSVAQRGDRQEQSRKQQEAKQRKQQKAEGRGQQNRRGQTFQPGRPGQANTPFERLRNMTPEEQQRAMNSPFFRRLPEQQQQRIRENLRRWNAMTPEQRQDLVERDRVWQEMTPEQRRHVRDDILPRWQNMEPRRRQAIVRRLGVLRPLNEEEREAKLKDEAFLAGLSEEEREILQTVAKLRLPPHEAEAPPPQDPPGEFPPQT